MALIVSLIFKRPVSSAKWNGEENLVKLCKSFMYKTKSRGPRIDACGTPKLTVRQNSINSNVLHSIRDII